ncbi:MAG: hypothetical protein EA387_02680 [Nitriliruptor sp.]|nr:MAG: hypothetical protein EA387_02680 [Nitriliruptor sp.]
MHPASAEEVVMPAPCAATGDARTKWRSFLDDPLPEHPDAGHFELVVERVGLVRVEGDELVVTTWDPVPGPHEQPRR